MTTHKVEIRRTRSPAAPEILSTAAAATSGVGTVLLLQSESSSEVRAALVAAAVLGYETRRMSLRTIQVDHAARGALGLLQAQAQVLPVGSVEFVRAAMTALGLREPDPMGYAGLQDYLQRDIRTTTVGELANLQAPAFIKPVATKLFTGFVYDPSQNYWEDPHVTEQLAALRKLRPETPLWICEPVSFQCEWRYYVDGSGRVLAQARYDADGSDDSPLPAMEVVSSAVDALVMHLASNGGAHPFALDVGVLENGRTAVIETNDAWAIGLYGHARTPGGADWGPRSYVDFLQQRWRAIVAQARRRRGERVARDIDEEEEQNAPVGNWGAAT